jgi:hypothetical protein
VTPAHLIPDFTLDDLPEDVFLPGCCIYTEIVTDGGGCVILCTADQIQRLAKELLVFQCGLCTDWHVPMFATIDQLMLKIYN